MKIDQLPVEVLTKIIHYMTTSTRNEFLLVNKRLHSVTPTKNDSNIWLQIDRHFVERLNCNNSTQWMENVQPSVRKISKIEIMENRMKDDRQIVSVVEAFSATIKFLKFTNIFIEPSTFMAILSLAPNLEHLDLANIYIRPSEIEGHPSKRRRYTDDLKLRNLKSLSITPFVGDNFEFSLLVPVGVLAELQVSCFEWNKLSVLLNRQLNVTKLKLRFGEDDAHIDIFDKLVLESLELDDIEMDSVTLEKILLKQRTLKSLILYEIVVDDRVMDTIAELLELERLAINVANLTVASFVKIRKLKQLKDLELQCNDTENAAILEALAQLDNSSMVKLSLSGFRNNVDDFNNIITTVSPQLIVTLAKSAPHLKHLKVLHAGFLCIRKLDEIMGRFNCVEVLEIPTWDEPLADLSDYFNPNLRELVIYAKTADVFTEMWLNKLIPAYPNLKKLKLIIDRLIRWEIAQFQIAPIVNGFKHLESLIMRADHTFQCVLTYLLEQKTNLKFVSLGSSERRLTIDVTDDMMNKLRRNFGVVNVDKFGRINMGLDWYTMNSERELCL